MQFFLTTKPLPKILTLSLTLYGLHFKLYSTFRLGLCKKRKV